MDSPILLLELPINPLFYSALYVTNFYIQRGQLGHNLGPCSLGYYHNTWRDTPWPRWNRMDWWWGTKYTFCIAMGALSLCSYISHLRCCRDIRLIFFREQSRHSIYFLSNWSGQRVSYISDQPNIDVLLASIISSTPRRSNTPGTKQINVIM